MMPPNSAGDLIPMMKDIVQIVASLAVILLALAAWFALRGTGRAGNRVQMDIDLQVIDIGASRELIGELMVVLQNMGNRHQKLWNLFLEVRPSKYVPNSAGVTMVPVTNMIDKDDHPLLLAPGVRQVLTWTFEIPRDERLLRATAVINTGSWMESDSVTELSKRNIWTFGPNARYASRVFEVSASSFRRF